MQHKCNPGYQSVLVQSYKATTSNHRYPVEIRPIPGEVFPPHLLVECSEKMHTDYPVGTTFRICARVKDTEYDTPHLYSYHGWSFAVISLPQP